MFNKTVTYSDIFIAQTSSGKNKNVYRLLSKLCSFFNSVEIDKVQIKIVFNNQRYI